MTKSITKSYEVISARMSSSRRERCNAIRIPGGRWVANELDISPESDAGCGPVDFKVSAGAKSKVLVELKRSSNSKVVDAYTSQLDAYKQAEDAIRAHYVIIDIGGLTAAKMRGLSEARSAVLATGIAASEIVIIDGNPQQSASKR